MRIITERKLREFWQAGTNAADKQAREKAMKEWIAVVSKANWKRFADIRSTFNHNDVYKNCVIFDVGGNKYRIIAKLGYRVKLIFIRFVMTHEECDEKKWCKDCK
jgi:mRNA interferase HigB